MKNQDSEIQSHNIGSTVWRVLLLCGVLFLLAACSARLSSPDERGNSSACGVGLSCGGVCVEPLSDDQNCGACGILCGAGQFCNAGSCEAFCVEGQANCGGTCVGVLSDSQNCGGCGLSCGAGEFCDKGACTATCSGGLCEGPTGGQCVHLAIDPSHCGACNNACADGLACQNGKCIAGCAPGRTACGDQCVDVASANLHCGVCGNACPTGQACENGVCGGGSACADGACGCAEGTTDCGGACVDTALNQFHCGECGLQCTGGQQCEGGVCACPNGGLLCDGQCVEAEGDNQNCGSCGNACQGSRTCVAGDCTCLDGLTECDGLCADTLVSPQHCGVCGNSCAGYESCVEGTCIFDEDSCGGAPGKIAINRVAVYQAVEVELYSEGEWRDNGERSNDVIMGRHAMVRLFVEPESGYAAQEISGRVFVDNDGEISAYFAKKTISDASSQSNLSSTFNVNIPKESIGPTTQFWVELAACGETDDGATGAVRLPTEGMKEMAARETGKVRVAFIPVLHGGRVPDVSAEILDAYAQEVDRMYPTNEFEVVDINALLGMSAQMSSGQSNGINLGNLLDSVTDFRKEHLDQGKITEDIYYYGLVDPAATFRDYCNGGCTTGIGWVPSASGSWAARNRAAVGIGFGTRGAGTFAHELGHNMGRNHSPCGGAGGPDPSYPHSGAKIGAWGYDRDAGSLRDPSEYVDFMGYCSPEWVSDYTFRALTERISSVNEDKSAFIAGKVPEAQWWHRARITQDESFWLRPEYGAPSADDEMVLGVVYNQAGDVIDEFPIHRIDMSDGGGYVIYVPPPQNDWYAIGQVGEWAVVY